MEVVFSYLLLEAQKARHQCTAESLLEENFFFSFLVKDCARDALRGKPLGDR